MSDSSETYAISDTGPLVSAFQSGSIALMAEIFDQILVTSVCRTELEEHGWREELEEASSRIQTVELTPGPEEVPGVGPEEVPGV